MQVRLITFHGIAPKQTDLMKDVPFAAVAQDVNLERGTIKAWNKPSKLSEAVGESLYVEDCCIITGDCDTRFAKTGLGCDEILAVTGLFGEPAFTTNRCSPEWEPLGFPCELRAPSVAVDGGDDKNFSLELRNYVYTVVNRMGWESTPSYPSENKRVNTMDAVTVSGFDVPRNAVSIRIYRAQTPLDFGAQQEDANDDAVFLLVGEIPATTGSFVDRIKVAGEALTTYDYDAPPDDLREISSWREGRLAGLSGDSFLMTERGLPHAWNRKFAVGFYDKPIALRCTERMAYVLTDGRPAVLGIRGDCDEGQSPIEVNEVLTSLPIVSRRSAAVFNDGVVFASRHGLVMMRGAEATVITKDYYTEEQWMALYPHTMVGEVCDGVYYGVTQNAMVRFTLPSDTFSSPPERALTTLSLRPRGLYTAENGRLYMAMGDGVYEWNGGTEKMPYFWRGKVQDMKGATRMSAYRLRTTANTHVKHHVNTTLVQDTTTDARPTRLPVGFTGDDWQVEFTGIGEITEYTLATSIRELI